MNGDWRGREMGKEPYRQREQQGAEVEKTRVDPELCLSTNVRTERCSGSWLERVAGHDGHHRPCQKSPLF